MDLLGSMTLASPIFLLSVCYVLFVDCHSGFEVFKIFRFCGDRYYKMKNWRHVSIPVLLKGNKLEERQKKKKNEV